MSDIAKTIVTILIVLVGGFLIANILGDEESWGTSYDSLGRTVTAMIVAGITGVIIWFLWRKPKVDN